VVTLDDWGCFLLGVCFGGDGMGDKLGVLGN
jgi:hypothetical protein